MSDKSKPLAAPSKASRTKRPSTVSVPTSSRSKTAIAQKVKNIPNSSRGDTQDFEAAQRQIAYGKFLRVMLEECIVDEKIERTELQMDIQVSLLGDRFKKTMRQLDKTNKRLKDISFVVEQKRLLDLKNKDSAKFLDAIDNSDAQDLLQNFNSAEAACLDKLETRNVDFGFDKESGHKQLLDVVTEAIEGLNEIKETLNLDMEKFNAIHRSQTNIQEIEKDRSDLKTLKADFEKEFPKLSGKILKEASVKISEMIKKVDD